MPLAKESCQSACLEKKVDRATCQQLCQVDQPTCPYSYWHKVIEKAKSGNTTGKLVASAPSVIYDSSRFSTSHLRRSRRSSEAQSEVNSSKPVETGPTEVVVSGKKKKYRELIPFSIPDPVTTPEPTFEIPFRNQIIKFFQTCKNI